VERNLVSTYSLRDTTITSPFPALLTCTIGGQKISLRGVQFCKWITRTYCHYIARICHRAIVICFQLWGKNLVGRKFKDNRKMKTFVTMMADNRGHAVKQDRNSFLRHDKCFSCGKVVEWWYSYIWALFCVEQTQICPLWTCFHTVTLSEDLHIMTVFSLINAYQRFGEIYRLFTPKEEAVCYPRNL
jgi:hypothetical protein